MKALVVLMNYPFPPRTGSTIVAYNTIKRLSNRHHFDLVCLKPRGALATPAEFFEQIELFPQQKNSRFAKWVRHLFYILMGVPPSVSECSYSELKDKVKGKIESGKYDAILMFEMDAIQYCPPSSFHKLVVNIEDPQSLKLCRMAELPIWPLWQKLKLCALARLTACYESRFLHKMAKILLLSEADIEDMRTQGAYKNLARVPYGVDQRKPTEIISYEDRKRTIVYSGNMFHPPNVDGALFLLKDIFPLILRECPSAILWIVGANPDNRIYAAAAQYGEQVVITGKVDDVAEYVKHATVSICPVRLKIGVQTKILEALSWGTPVVTTSAGNAGVGGVSGTHLWVEDDANLIAKRVCGLLQGRDWKTISDDGRRLVAERFSWDASAKQFEQCLETLAEASR